MGSVDVAQRVRSITDERLGDRLPADKLTDELGRIATVCNDTLGALESSFDHLTGVIAFVEVRRNCA